MYELSIKNSIFDTKLTAVSITYYYLLFEHLLVIIRQKRDSLLNILVFQHKKKRIETTISVGHLQL